jgi:hypothetical protein
VKTRYVLVDCENVQPDGFEKLRDDAFKVKMFIGAKQNTPKNAKKALELLGEHAERIDISGSGKNAADFHIAYYIGRLSVESKDVLFYVVSKDKGFDPLIKHLQMHGVNCSRVASLEKIVPTKPVPKPETAGAKAAPEAKPKATKAVPKKRPTTANEAGPHTKQATTKAIPKKKPVKTKPVPKTKPTIAKVAEDTKAGMAKRSKSTRIPTLSNKERKALSGIPAAVSSPAQSSAQESAAHGKKPTTAKADVPNPRKVSAIPLSAASLADKVITNLGTGRKPGLLENLKSTIKDLFMELINKPLSSGEIDATIEEMKRRRFIKVADGVISYIAPYKQVP